MRYKQLQGLNQVPGVLPLNPQSSAAFTGTFMQKPFRRLLLTAINDRTTSCSLRLGSDQLGSQRHYFDREIFPATRREDPCACGFIKRNSGHDQDLSLLPLDHNVHLRVRFPTSQTRSRIG